MNPQPKPVRETDDRYGHFVRLHTCCTREVYPHDCYGPVQAHHVSPRNGTKGMGITYLTPFGE